MDPLANTRAHEEDGGVVIVGVLSFLVLYLGRFAEALELVIRHADFAVVHDDARWALLHLVREELAVGSVVHTIREGEQVHVDLVAFSLQLSESGVAVLRLIVLKSEGGAQEEKRDCKSTLHICLYSYFI